MASNVVGDLVINLATNIASLVVGMKQATNVVNNAAKQMSDAFATVQKTLGLIGVGVSFGALVSSIKSVIDYADHLNDLSKSTGIAVETLGGLAYAAKQSGVDLETVAKGTQKLAQAMADAAGGNAETTALFESMGVKIKDVTTGALRPMSEVLLDVADKFKSYKDGPEKAALANELFKKGGAALIPMLNEGGEKLRELIAEWQKYGGITTDTAQRADTFNDTLEKLKLMQGSLFREIASALLPTLQAIANIFVDAKSKGEGFKEAAEAVVVVVKALAIAGVGVVAAFQAVGKSIGAITAAFIAVIEGNYRQAWSIIKEGWNDVGDVIGNAMTRASVIANASTATIKNTTETNLAQTAAPIKNVAKAVDELSISLVKLLKPFADMAAELGKTGTQLQAQLVHLQKYGTELKQTALITAEYELTEGKLAERFQVLQFLYPQLAEAVRFIILGRAQLNDETGRAIELEKDYLAAIRETAAKLADSVRAVEDQIKAEVRHAQEIGKTREEIVQLDIAETEHALTLAQEAAAYGDVTVEVAALTAKLQRLRELKGAVGETERVQTQFDQLRSMFSTLDQIGRDVFESIGDKGVNMWERLKAAGKKIFLDFLYQLTLRPFLVQISATLSGVSQGAAANVLGGGGAGGGGNLLSMLFGGGSSGLFSAGTAGAAALGAGFSAGMSSLGIVANVASNAIAGGSGLVAGLTAGADAIGGMSAAVGALGAVAGAAIPVLGLAFAAYSYFQANKKPTEVRGRFQVGGTDFEDSVSTPSKFGALGFADVDTQQFSGEAAQIFNKIVAGALDAFEQRFTAEQTDRLAGILQSTDFGSFEGTLTTEEFLQRYGGGVLQQVVAAAFDVLDPALGAVARAFTGTADEVAKFANTLLGVYDVTKAIGDADFTAGIDEALAGATQESADKILGFVGVVAAFGTSIEGLGDAFKSLDPSKIVEFVDALGGVQAFAQAFATFNQNFGTAADVAATATTRLNTAFGKLGIEVPKTHEQFVQILNHFIAIGDTDAVATLLGVSDAFVTLNGTAEQLRQGLLAAAEAGRKYFVEHFLTPAEQLGGRQTVDSTVLFNATRGTTELGKAMHALGVDELPLTIEGVRNFRAQLVALYGEGSDVVNQFDAVIPVIGDLIDSVGGFGDAASNAAATATQAANDINKAWDQIHEQLDAFGQSLQDLGTLASGSKDFGTQLQDAALLYADQVDAIKAKMAAALAKPTPFNMSQYTYVYTPQLAQAQKAYAVAAERLARFEDLTNRYGEAIAAQLVPLQEWYRQQKQIFAGNDAALAIVDAQLTERWNDIVNGTKTGVDNTLDQLARLRAGIADYLKGLALGNLSPLSPAQQLHEAQFAYVDELMKAKAGDLTALGDITKFADAYLKEAQSFFSAPSTEYRDIFNAVREQLGDLAGTLPTGLPADSMDALVAALPANGPIASDATIREELALTRTILQQLLTQLADSNTADSIDERAAITAASNSLQSVLADSGLK